MRERPFYRLAFKFRTFDGPIPILHQSTLPVIISTIPIVFIPGPD